MLFKQKQNADVAVRLMQLWQQVEAGTRPKEMAMLTSMTWPELQDVRVVMDAAHARLWRAHAWLWRGHALKCYAPSFSMTWRGWARWLCSWMRATNGCAARPRALLRGMTVGAMQAVDVVTEWVNMLERVMLQRLTEALEVGDVHTLKVRPCAHTHARTHMVRLRAVSDGWRSAAAGERWQRRAATQHRDSCGCFVEVRRCQLLSLCSHAAAATAARCSRCYLFSAALARA